MASFKTMTREKILEAIELYDRLGPKSFHDFFGFSSRSAWAIWREGKRYPSKAILGAAADLTPSDFFGGIAQTVPVLQRLGFEVRRGTKSVKNLAFHAIEEWESQGCKRAYPKLSSDPSAYFASGSNRPGEIRGLASVGHDIGVAAGELNEQAIQELERLAGSDIQIFVDSGAFSEMKLDPNTGRLFLHRPISSDQWIEILDLYLRLGKSLGSQLWVVAPDRIGDQQKTLELIEDYELQLREIEATGARILLPVQKGRSSQLDFWRMITEGSGIDFIPALPCKKQATGLYEAREFMEQPKAIRPKHLHLLGLGIRNHLADKFLQLAEELGFSLSFDSNWICANVGRVPEPRTYTKARDLAKTFVSEPAEIAELAMIFCLATG
jgi:hypothetical protein